MSSRHLAVVLAAATTFGPIIACGRTDPPPPVDDTRSSQSQTYSAPMGQPQAKTGMSTGKKVVILAGAAALYYMYKHHQSAAATSGPDGQYYLSKNGRVYYRDAEHRAHWVTPPAEGLTVPESEAGEYRQFQGYDGSTTGRDLVGLGSDE